jgi:hypothetical protein
MSGSESTVGGLDDERGGRGQDQSSVKHGSTEAKKRKDRGRTEKTGFSVLIQDSATSGSAFGMSSRRPRV